ncbi:MAG: anti-sigma-factor antagonist [Blastococcus sp.]|nr:anti-sigma-factor antagonist [Blastococcus sp.]
MTASSLNPTTTELVSVEVTLVGPGAVVTAVGEIDSTSAPVLRDRLESLLEGEVSEVTVDLSAVTFLDSAGLCVLAAAHRRATRQDVTLRVLASSRAVIRPLQITGLWNLLKAEQIETGDSARLGVGVA